ncbi:MAG: indole-3-glycerol phosphate synthase TrpC [Deltaproteobacteria bacterium]
MQTRDTRNRLEEILASVRTDLESRKRQVPIGELSRRAARRGAARKIRSRIGTVPGVIAEVKRASPSRGTIRQDLDAARLAAAYEEAGACAVSILTESRFFGGSLADLDAASGATREVPILRKDFLLDEYMLVESRAYGADLVLLIAAALGPETATMVGRAREYGLEPLVEIHDEAELEKAIEAGAGIIGVNNRDLTRFAVDLRTAERLLPKIPAGTLRVVESGIRDPLDLHRFLGLGADLFLIGEALVRAEDPALRLKEFLRESNPNEWTKEGEEWKRKSS